MLKLEPLNSTYDEEKVIEATSIALSEFYTSLKYSLQGTTQGNGLTGADMPVRFSM